MDFYRRFETDPELGPVLARWRGMRPPNCSSLYEYLIIAIVLQNATVRRSVNMMQALFENYGTLLSYDGKDLYSIEIDIRDANSYYGIGKDRCRNLKRILGVNSFRFLMASVRTLWFIQKMASNKTPNWRRFRPWYRHKEKPSQLDVMMVYHKALSYAGISPTIRFLQDMPEIYAEQDKTLHEVA